MTDKLKKTDENTAMAMPSFIPSKREGMDHIGKDDILMPRLAIAQQMSPQVNPTEAKFIEGLKQGEAFNTLSGKVYGSGPLNFYILRADSPRWIEFFPREAGGGVKTMNVPAGDPLTEFYTDENGKKHNPRATKFYDFLVLLEPIDPADPMSSVMAMSFKSTGLKVARALNGLMRFRPAHPIYAARYELSVVQERNPKGTFFNFAVKNAGWVSNESLLEALADLSGTLSGREVVTDLHAAADAEDAGGEAEGDA